MYVAKCTCIIRIEIQNTEQIHHKNRPKYARKYTIGDVQNKRNDSTRAHVMYVRQCHVQLLPSPQCRLKFPQRQEMFALRRTLQMFVMNERRAVTVAKTTLVTMPQTFERREERCAILRHDLVRVEKNAMTDVDMIKQLRHNQALVRAKRAL